MVEVTENRPADADSAAPEDSEELARQQVIRQAKARRLFRISTTASGVGVALLVPIWAATEYQHAGGWPTGGFSQRSGSPNVWNCWIIYPAIAWASMTAASGWAVYGRQQIPAGEIGRKTGEGLPALFRSARTRVNELRHKDAGAAVWSR